jgi:hypothetical protein
VCVCVCVCVKVLRNVTTQQQQPLEAGRQIIFQEGVAWTNERPIQRKNKTVLCK